MASKGPLILFIYYYNTSLKMIFLGYYGVFFLVLSIIQINILGICVCYIDFCLPESLHKEVQDLAFLDVVSKLRSHENKSVAQQASLTEQRLTVES